MRNLVSTINRISKWSGEVLLFLIFPMVAFPAIEVIVMRLLLKHPTIWSQELTLFIFGTYFMLGGAYCLSVKGHVAMDMIYNRLRPQVRVVADILIFLVIFLVCSVMVWLGSKWAWKATLTGEHSQSFWHPIIWPVRWTIPVGASMLIIQAIADLIHAIQVFLGSKDKEKTKI